MILEKRHSLSDSDAKGKRTKCKGLGNILNETEANEVVPEVGGVPVPVGCTQ
jgi:hypothetical protein